MDNQQGGSNQWSEGGYWKTSQNDLTCSPGHHKGATYDGKKESQRIIYKHKRRFQDRWSKSWIKFHKNFNKLVKILQKTQTSEISKADEKQKLERDIDN